MKQTHTEAPFEVVVLRDDLASFSQGQIATYFPAYRAILKKGRYSGVNYWISTRLGRDVMRLEWRVIKKPGGRVRRGKAINLSQ